MNESVYNVAKAVVGSSRKAKALSEMKSILHRNCLLLAMHYLGSAHFICAWPMSASGFTTPPRQPSLIHRNSMSTTTAPDMTSKSASNSSFSSKYHDENNNNDNNNNKSLLPLLDPLVVCGPSGVGKGTIIQKYMDELGGKQHFGFTVSHTTRPPRPGEIHGVHYYFVNDKDEMQRQIDEGNSFLEHAHVHGNLYGTSFEALYHVQQVQRRRCLLDIDVQGVRNLKRVQQVRRDSFSPKYVFITPPSLSILQQRLILRGTETPENIQCRTEKAAEEVEYGLQPGNFDKIIVNDDLDQACQDFSRAVQELYNL